MTTYTIGIDLGGTKIAAGLCKNGEILEKITIPTEAKKGTDHILKTMVDAAKQVMGDTTKNNISGVGIGAAGQINPRSGEVIYAPNLGWKNVPLGSFLQEKLDLPVKVLNDVRAATLAEFKFGNGKGHSSFVNIFVGTGVGSGFVVNGELLNGFTNSAGEIGHICMDPEGPKCGCGKLGCLEAYCSGTGMENYVKAQLETGHKSLVLELAEGDIQKITGPIIGKAAAAGDVLALESIKRVGTYLGIAIANVHTLFNPETVLLGGGMMALKDYFMPSLLENMNKLILPVASKNPALIKEARFENDAVLLGGSAIFS
jgi:glucokinase